MNYQSLVNKALETVNEVMPWDLMTELTNTSPPLLLDIREQNEFDMMSIKGSIHIPRGILESACEWGYEDTMPALANSRKQNIVLVCRSGKRSALAGQTLQQLGFNQVRSLKLGIKGWNDHDLAMVNQAGQTVDGDKMDEILSKPVSQEKQNPNG